jgi:ADP-ribose pyrophosphatase YjhB (NUDIX family)
MSAEHSDRWVDWAREIQALAQTGQHYAADGYQSARYQRLIEISAEIFADHTRLPQVQLMEVFSPQTGYATPRVDVRGAVFQNGKLLMVRERIDDGWTLPGGWADVGDAPSEAVEREIMEEAGLLVKTSRLVGVYDANRIPPLELFHAYKLVFLCEVTGGDARAGEETSQVEFFGRHEIPDHLSGERTHWRHIEDAFSAHQDSGWRTRYD